MLVQTFSMSYHLIEVYMIVFLLNLLGYSKGIIPSMINMKAITSKSISKLLIFYTVCIIEVFKKI